MKTMTKRISQLALMSACAAAAHADVSVTTQTSGKASFINVGGEAVTQFKGKRQRSEQTMRSAPPMAGAFGDLDQPGLFDAGQRLQHGEAANERMDGGIAGGRHTLHRASSGVQNPESTPREAG